MFEKYENVKLLINDCAVKFKNNTAFKVKKKDEKGKVYYDEVTYSRLNDEVEYLARAFMKKGLQGKRIAVIGKNSYEWMVVYLATLCSGSVIVPLDRGLLDFEIEEQLSRSEASAIFFGEAFTERMEKYTDIVKVCTDGSEFLEWIEEGKECDNKAQYDAIEIDPYKMSLLLFTSGTTSRSKAVMLSHDNLTSNVYSMTLWEKLYETDVNMALLPFHHSFGMMQTLLFLSFGMTNVFCEGLRIAKCLNEYGVTVFVGVPRVIEEMMLTVNRKIESQGKTGKIKFALKLSGFLRKIGIDIRRKLFKQIIDAMGGGLRLIIIGAAAASPEVLEFFNNIGILSIQGYGLTESSPVISAENDTHMRRNSVGLAIPGVEAKIVNPDENGVGEIVAKGGNIMLGYYNNEKETNAVLKDGWLYTGDMGKIDKDGYIFILGRKKNVVVLSNGKNVFPEEIETLVNLSPAIKECVVYGENDKIFATIVADTNYEGDKETAIKEHIASVNEKLIHFKKISDYTIQKEEMEKTTTGKIKRYMKVK